MPKMKVVVEINDAHTVEEVAVIFGIGVATVWRWLARGKLHGFKLAGRTLIPTSEIERIKDEGGELIVEKR